jgi:hypothetical protein
VVGTNRADAAQRFLEVGVDRASADAVQTLEFAGSPEVVALDPQVQATQWEDQGDESRRGKRNDNQREDCCDP